MPPDDKLIFNSRGDCVRAFVRGEQPTLQITGRHLGKMLTVRGTELHAVEMDLDRESGAALIRQIAEVVGIKVMVPEEVFEVTEAVRRVFPADMAPFRRTIPITGG